MPTFLIFDNARAGRLPRHLRGDDTRGPEYVARYLLNRFTERGDTVLDPFAGFGTTLVVSERMGRNAFGVERDPRRASFIRSRIRDPTHLVQGDSRNLSSFDLPKFDFCLTSPTYMARDEARNPLSPDRKGGTLST